MALGIVPQDKGKRDFLKITQFDQRYIQKTKCAVKVENSITDFFDYSKGVRQGCPLSPILFNIYVNDIFKLMNENNKSNIFLNKEENINALMYADDLILLSETKEGLQGQIDKLSEYCKKWKLEVNIKKTKIMIFNRGNKLIKTEFHINNSPLENVKTFKYLGFTISTKNCSFLPTIDDLSVKANRAIYVLNNKMKLSKLPTRLALKLFMSQIKPILLYGSEVWGPYTDFDYKTWDKNKIERVHTQYLKRILGCSYQTSNNMTRGEVGTRPLLLDIIKRVISYTKNIKGRDSSIVYEALEFETKNDINPNFCTFINKFQLNSEELLVKEKHAVNTICRDNYDRYWCVEIRNSPKALSYATFKNTVYLEKYLYEVKNLKHKIALSHLRLSNNTLLIEKGRHMRPRLERNERKCFVCKDQIEDENHFIVKCPLYSKERAVLFQSCRENCMNFDLLTTDVQKFIFIMTNENPSVIAKLASFVFNAFKVRDSAINSQ